MVEGSAAIEFSIITLFPEMFSAFCEFGVSGKAVKSGQLAVSLLNPRDYTLDKHRTVDDRPFGGGPGMLMKAQPLCDAIRAAKSSCKVPSKVIYLSPQGRQLNQQGVNELAQWTHLIFVCGRYEGVDERVIQSEVDEEWSIGDYVLSGGELAAMVFMDSLCRMIPGVLGDGLSAKEDSFYDGLLDCPHYTRPLTFEGQQVPEVLLSGNHQKIRAWRLKQALYRTWIRRPDLLKNRKLSIEEQALLNEFKSEHSSHD